MPGVRRPAVADAAASLAILAVVAAAVLTPTVLRRLGGRPAPEDCAALLDRYVEFVGRAAVPAPSASAIAERRAAVRAAAGDRGFARCEAELTPDEVACGLRAGNADEIERCLP
ncbi:MAG: hypothetical protein IT372_18830 [Polyangiaceae bacterium]|nr:hypothetical protein [Polyangiaceae bacterium]